jgi:hypothetical protein
VKPRIFADLDSYQPKTTTSLAEIKQSLGKIDPAALGNMGSFISKQSLKSKDFTSVKQSLSNL